MEGNGVPPFRLPLRAWTPYFAAVALCLAMGAVRSEGNVLFVAGALGPILVAPLLVVGLLALAEPFLTGLGEKARIGPRTYPWVAGVLCVVFTVAVLAAATPA